MKFVIDTTNKTISPEGNCNVKAFLGALEYLLKADLSGYSLNNNPDKSIPWTGPFPYIPSPPNMHEWYPGEITWGGTSSEVSQIIGELKETEKEKIKLLEELRDSDWTAKQIKFYEEIDSQRQYNDKSSDESTLSMLKGLGSKDARCGSLIASIAASDKVRTEDMINKV